MKTEKEIRQRLKELESDARLHYEPALVQINAPLALIQVELENKVNTLRWVLGEKPFERKKKAKYG